MKSTDFQYIFRNLTLTCKYLEFTGKNVAQNEQISNYYVVHLLDINSMAIINLIIK